MGKEKQKEWESKKKEEEKLREKLAGSVDEEKGTEEVTNKFYQVVRRLKQIRAQGIEREVDNIKNARTVFDYLGDMIKP